MNAEYVFSKSWEILKDQLEPSAALEVSLQALVGLKLIALGQVSEELSLEKNFFADSEEFFSALNHLVSIATLNSSKDVIETVLVRSVVSDSTTAKLQMMLKQVLQTGMLKDFTLPPNVLPSLRNGTFSFQIPDEVVQVMLQLPGDMADQSIYCPYDDLLHIAGHVARMEGIPSVELPVKTTIPLSLRFLNDVNVEIQFSDPLWDPSYTEGGQLKRFDITIAFPPISNKVGDGVVDRDLFGRFPERTTSSTVLAIRHVIAQTREKAVIAVPNVLLFGRGSERTLREDLLNRRMVEAVISVAPGLLPYTGVAFSILVLDMQGKASSVRLMDGSNGKFVERIGRGRIRLSQWENLLSVYRSLKDESLVRQIDFQTILDNDASLEVSQYLLPPEYKEVNQLIGTSKTCPLQHVVDLIRPSQKLQGNDEIKALEVGVGDFPEFGYLTTPTKQVEASASSLKGKEMEQFLRGGDIIMAIKGSVGRVAIVPDSAPPAGENGWLINQSCIILRSRKIDPRVLFMYLRSDVGQTLIQRIVSGATTLLIQLRPLQQLPVILPPLEEAQAVIRTFEQQADIQKEIAQLRQEQQRLDKTHWQLRAE